MRIVAAAAQQVLLRAGAGRVRRGPDSRPVHLRHVAATIGGDLYEVIAAPDATRFIIGDVQGKGLAAVKLASTVLGAFREVAPDTSDLAVITARIEATLAREASPMSSS